MSDSKYKRKCLNIFEKMEDQQAEIITYLDSQSNEQRLFSIKPEKWNSLQIILHLITAEKLSLRYMKRKVNSNEQLETSGFLSKLRMLVLKFAFRLPFKYTAPRITDSTGQEPDYEKLKSDWDSVRSELKLLIQNLDEQTLKGEIFKHPRVGMINMKQALKFMEIHVTHHQKQIANNIELYLRDQE